MEDLKSKKKEIFKGHITSSTRQFVTLVDSSGASFLGKRSAREMELSPGDVVSFQKPNDLDGNSEVDILNVEERKNCLKRSYFGKTKVLASNLDCLWIVTAPPPLFNALAIDRTLLAATAEGIPVVLIANKDDLNGYSEIKSTLEYYKNICKDVYFVSAKSGSNISILKSLLENEVSTTAVTGISGVGKSSLLKRLLSLSDNELIRVDDVSEKTGQGRQTTSTGMGYLLSKELIAGCISAENEENSDLCSSMIIDLPGIQSYGVSHLSESQIKKSMSDIFEISLDCKFSDCKHDKEPFCEVKNALKDGRLLESRIYSQQDMINEVKKSNAF